MGSDAIRLALISPEFPAPPTSGGKKRTFHLLDALARLGTVDLITFSEHPEAETPQLLHAICRRVDIIRLPEHSRRLLPFLIRNLRRAARGINPLIDRFSESSVCETLWRRLHHETYDLVVLEHSWIAHYISLVRDVQPQARIILDCHNIESDLWRQYYEHPPKFWHKLAAYRFWRSALEQERTYLRLADLVWVVSETDAERARALAPSARVRVIPNGTIPLPREALSANVTGPPIIGFLGSLDYPPNESGMRFFLDRIWPAIRAAVPDARLMVIGRPSAWLLRRARTDAHLFVVGEVSDITPYLRQWALMVVPLLYGGGTRMKILDAWAHGIAVVSTSKGAEGIHTRPGEEVWIADAPNEFAHAVIHLLRDAAERHRLARSGYERARCDYSWDTIAERARHQVITLLTGNDVSL